MIAGAVGVGPPWISSCSADSRRAVWPMNSRTRHRAPRARISVPKGSSPRVDRCSTSPSGNRRVRIGVVGMQSGHRARAAGFVAFVGRAPRTRSAPRFQRDASRASACPCVAPCPRSPKGLSSEVVLEVTVRVADQECLCGHASPLRSVAAAMPSPTCRETARRGERACRPAARPAEGRRERAVCPQTAVGIQTAARGVSPVSNEVRRLVGPPGCHLLRHPALLFPTAPDSRRARHAISSWRARAPRAPLLSEQPRISRLRSRWTKLSAW